MLVPSKMGKLPRTEFNGTNEAGSGAHTAVSGVQLLAKPALPPAAAGWTPSVATAEEAPARKTYDEMNWKRGSVAGNARKAAFARIKSACAGVTWPVPAPGRVNG